MRLTKFLAFAIVVAGMFAWAFAANAADIDEMAANSGRYKSSVASVQAADLGTDVLQRRSQGQPLNP